MAKQWSEIDDTGKQLIKMLLAAPRDKARRTALIAVQDLKRLSHDERVLAALRIAEHAEESIDAALERLGLK